MILSQFNYCDCLLSNISVSLSNKIQKVQNSCIRFIYSLKRYDHVSHFLKPLGWLNMSSRQRLHCLCLIFKIVSGLAPDYLTTYLLDSSHSHQYATRYSDNLTIPHFRSHIKQNSFFCKNVSQFNSLPISIKQSPSLSSFKIKLYHYFQDH